MMNAPSLTRLFHSQPPHPCAGRASHCELDVLEFLDREREQKASRLSLFGRYVEGWAEADVSKILDAAASNYRFTDPFVGTFSGRLLHEYFDLLEDRLSRMGAISRRDLEFYLYGPMERSRVSVLQFWREAPRIGITGISEIEIGERGIIAERAAYDPNLASDLLCRPAQPTRWASGD